MTMPYERLAHDFHRLMTRDPNACVAKGVDENLDRLPDPSADEARRCVGEARALLARIGELQLGGDAAALSFDQRLDLDLASLMLERAIHDDTYTFNGRTRRAQLPKAGDEIGDGLFLMFVNDPRPPATRLSDICARLEQVPDYAAAMIGRLDTPLARWVGVEQQKVAALPELFASLDAWAEQERFADLSRLRRARGGAEAALASYREQLAALPTTDQLHLDDGIARRVVELRGIEPALETLHQVARRWLDETLQTIEQLRARLVAKHSLARDTSAAQLQAHLRRRYRVALPAGAGLEAVVPRYERELERVVEFIGERSLFSVPAEQALKILRTPGFLEPSIPAGAMMPPPAFRPGVKTSLVYLTLGEERLDEHTELSIPTMIIHEGIPGHHLQLASAALHPSVIRRHVDALDQAEGWTTMLEDYLLDLGYMGELTDEARFSTKRELSRIAARVGIDLFFLTGERGFLELGIDCDTSATDPFVAAGNLLQTLTGFTPGRVQAELNWYSEERGYPLCYLTGNWLVTRLKADVAQANRGHLEGLDLDRAFHRAYLEAGNMPLSLLRRAMREQGLLPALS